MTKLLIGLILGMTLSAGASYALYGNEPMTNYQDSIIRGWEPPMGRQFAPPPPLFAPAPIMPGFRTPC